MRSTQTENQPEATNPDSTWSSAAKLSRKVRELAHRSHRALKAETPPDAPALAPPEDLAEDLRDLRAQVARLQQRIHKRRLTGLIPWVDALHHLVEERLDRARKAGAR